MALDWFGFDDPAVPRRLTAPAGLEAVHQDGYSWARQGTRKEDTSWISPDQWNRLVAQMRGLLNDPAIDVSDLAQNAPTLLRVFIARKIVAILANLDVPSYGLMPKADYDPDDDGIIGLAQGGTGVAATDNADLMDKLGISTAIDAAMAALVASSTAALAGKLALDGSNVGGNAAALRTAIGAAATGGLVELQAFTSSGIYTPAAGVTRILVIGQAAGGGGGGVAVSGSNRAGSGGAGETRIGVFSVSGAVTVTIGAAGGAGGAGPNTGGTAGDTTIGSLMTCKGGTGGVGATGSASGSHGTTPAGSGGSPINPVAAPRYSNTNNVAFGGSTLFGLALGYVGQPDSDAIALLDGRGCGGIGATNTGTSARAGGDGRPGIVYILGFR